MTDIDPASGKAMGAKKEIEVTVRKPGGHSGH